jgi:hypothetical protein
VYAILAMININDSLVDDLLKSCKSIKPSSKAVDKTILNEIEKQCRHKRSLSRCMTCTYESYIEKPTTDHKIARAFYVNFAKISRSYPHYEKTTEAQEKLFHDDTVKNRSHILRFKECSDVNIMIEMSDTSTERYLDDDELIMYQYVFGKYYDSKKILGEKQIDYDDLSEDQKFKLKQLRRHIFENQMRHIKKELENGIRYDRSQD